MAILAGGVFNSPGVLGPGYLASGDQQDDQGGDPRQRRDRLGYRPGQITRSYADLMGPQGGAPNQATQQMQQQAAAEQQRNQALADQQNQQLSQGNAASSAAVAQRVAGGPPPTPLQQQIQYGLQSDYNKAVYQQAHTAQLGGIEQERDRQQAATQERRDRLLADFQEGRDYRQAGFENQRDYNQAVYHAMHQEQQAGYESQRQERGATLQQQRDYQQAQYEAAHQGRGFEQQNQMQQQQFQQQDSQAVLHSNLATQQYMNQLSADEMARMARMRDALNSLSRRTDLSPQESRQYEFLLRTGIDEGLKKMNASQAAHTQMQTSALGQQMDFNATHEAALNHMRTQTIDDRTVHMHDPQGRRIASGITDVDGSFHQIHEAPDAQERREESSRQAQMVREAREDQHLGDLDTNIRKEVRDEIHELGPSPKPEDVPAWARTRESIEQEITRRFIESGQRRGLHGALQRAGHIPGPQGGISALGSVRDQFSNNQTLPAADRQAGAQAADANSRLLAEHGTPDVMARRNPAAFQQFQRNNATMQRLQGQGGSPSRQPQTPGGFSYTPAREALPAEGDQPAMAAQPRRGAAGPLFMGPPTREQQPQGNAGGSPQQQAPPPPTGEQTATNQGIAADLRSSVHDLGPEPGAITARGISEFFDSEAKRARESEYRFHNQAADIAERGGPRTRGEYNILERAASSERVSAETRQRMRTLLARFNYRTLR